MNLSTMVYVLIWFLYIELYSQFKELIMDLLTYMSENPFVTCFIVLMTGLTVVWVVDAIFRSRE